MPHQQRRYKSKRKKPNRKQPLFPPEEVTDPETLREHRELALLRIAGGARQGKRRTELLEERIRKLQDLDEN